MPSYSPVFSAAFIEYTPETRGNTFLVPAGFTAVVRECSCFQDIGAFLYTVDIQNDLAAPALTVFAVVQTGVVNYVRGEGRWVVPGGGQITAEVDTYGDDCNMYVGGYLLRNSLS